MSIKRTLQMIGILMAAAVARSQADSPPPDTSSKPAVLEAAAYSMSGTVESIDYTTRMVTLTGKNGKSITMEVGPAAARFNEVKKGDVVTLDYLNAVAVSVHPASQGVTSAMGSSTVLIRNKSKLPSGTAIQTDTITATVVKINAEKRTAVLRGPQGNEFKVDVAPDVQDLQNVKKGDMVVVTVTHTLAVSVSKPAKS